MAFSKRGRFKEARKAFFEKKRKPVFEGPIGRSKCGAGQTPAAGVLATPAAVANAMALLVGNPAAAERQAREILKFLPDDARAVFILGAARRRQGDAAGARSPAGQGGEGRSGVGQRIVMNLG